MCRDQELAPPFAVEILVEDQPHKFRVKRGFYLINRKEAVTFFRVINGGFDTKYPTRPGALFTLRKHIFLFSARILHSVFKHQVRPRGLCLFIKKELLKLVRQDLTLQKRLFFFIGQRLFLYMYTRNIEICSFE